MARDNTVYDDRLMLRSEIDIFADRSSAEVEEIGNAAPRSPSQARSSERARLADEAGEQW